MHNIRSRLARGSLWISGARGATTLLNFASTIVLARILVPADFGLVALASTMLAVLTAVTNLSIGSALVHHKDPTEDHYHTAWTLGVARGLILAAIFCLAAWPFAKIYAEPRLDEVMYALSITIVATGFTNPRLIMMQKKLIFWQVFVLQVANNLVMASVSIIWALVYDNYWALVVGAILGQLTSTITSYAMFPFRPRLSLKHIRELISFSIWLTLGQAVNTLNYRFDHLLLGGILGRTALGHYAVGSNLAAAATREAILPLTQTLFPAFSLVSDNLDRLRRGYERAQATVTAIALPIGIGVALVADPLVRLAMGEKWAPAVPVIQVIASIYALGTLGTLVGPLAMSQGATRLLFFRAIQLFLLRVPFILAGMLFWGLIGMLYARAFVGLIGIMINMSMVRSLIGVSIADQLRSNLRCFLASAAMAGLVIGLQKIVPPAAGALDLATEVALAVAAGTTTYLSIGAMLWLAAGRPTGPETEALEAGRKLIGWLKQRRSTARAERG